MNIEYLNTICNVKAEQGLTYLENESIDLVITSPPYDKTRNYHSDKKDDQQNNFEFDIDIIIDELYRVLKKGGVIIWVVADQTKDANESGTSFQQAIKFKDRGFNLYDTMIFSKTNPIPKTHRRYEQAFEYMFMFSKGTPKTANIIMQPSKFAGNSRVGNTYRQDISDELSAQHNEGRVLDYKIRNNIFEYTVGKDEAYGNIVKRNHPAKFPILLVRDQMLSWSNKDDVILDPFSGSGTTAIASILTGRKYIGFEKKDKYAKDSIEYIKIVEEKIKDNEKCISDFRNDVSKIIYKEFEK